MNNHTFVFVFLKLYLTFFFFFFYLEVLAKSTGKGQDYRKLLPGLGLGFSAPSLVHFVAIQMSPRSDWLILQRDSYCYRAARVPVIVESVRELAEAPPRCAVTVSISNVSRL